MGLFDINENSVRTRYDKACSDSGHGFVDPRDYPDLDRELMAYSITHNCTYDEAYLLAKTGRTPDSVKKSYDSNSNGAEIWCIGFFIVVFLLVLLFCN